MTDTDDQKFITFTLPDVSKVDPTKLKRFSRTAPNWRKVGKGLNLEGKCKNKKC